VFATVVAVQAVSFGTPVCEAQTLATQVASFAVPWQVSGVLQTGAAENEAGQSDGRLQQLPPRQQMPLLQ
jgi:hypothetical protein